MTDLVERLNRHARDPIGSSHPQVVHDWLNTAVLLMLEASRELAAAHARGREEGAVEMRERAAQEAEAARVQSYTPHQHPEKIAARIRALPTTGGTVPAKAEV